MSAPVPVFTDEPLAAILTHVRGALAGGAATVTLRALDPDHGRGRYPGEVVEVDGVAYRHRSWRLWVELAERLGLRLATPRPAPAPLVEVRLERLDPAARWHDDVAPDRTEKYGAASGFARVSKLEEPAFVLDLAEAVARLRWPARPRILDLGVNTGDEVALLLALVPGLADGAELVGVDHSASALAVARRRFADRAAIRFVEADLGDLAGLAAHALGRFDLVLSIGTLQSPGIDDRALLRQLVQDHLAPGGAIILGVPNCRYVDGEVEHGARVRNRREPELGLVIKDVAFYRKYLQQHRREVFVTGSRYLLVTAVPVAGAT
ncbi:MAG: class I SAM-dependent methyltransferase [Kofleriaceae bacterium]|nr:class I SAM-dependent methyltransferase [Kofleriaceae bacterium]